MLIKIAQMLKAFGRFFINIKYKFSFFEVIDAKKYI